MKHYYYYINLDERGEFFADVRDKNDKTIFNLHGHEFFEDGFMSDRYDLDGLHEYLVDVGLINENDSLERTY